MSHTNDHRLTPSDHVNLESLFGHILDDHKADRLTKEQAVAGLRHIVSSLDEGRYEEVSDWARQGRKYIQRLEVATA